MNLKKIVQTVTHIFNCNPLCAVTHAGNKIIRLNNDSVTAYMEVRGNHHVWCLSTWQADAETMLDWLNRR